MECLIYANISLPGSGRACCGGLDVIKMQCRCGECFWGADTAMTGRFVCRTGHKFVHQIAVIQKICLPITTHLVPLLRCRDYHMDK